MVSPQDYFAMTTSTNLTSGILSPEEVQAGPADTVMTMVFLGVVAGTMMTLLSGTVWAWRKEHQEKKMVRTFNQSKSQVKIVSNSSVFCKL